MYMQNIKLLSVNWLISFVLLTLPLQAMVLYESLDPTSIVQHLAYYELYKESPDGKKALEHAWKLLSGKDGGTLPLAFPHTINTFVALINPSGTQESFEIGEEALCSIEDIASHLPNRLLLGHKVYTIDELLTLETDEIDLARAILLSQLDGDRAKIRRYEAMLDLMTLQVLARIGIEAPSEDKVRALNQLIFYDLGFRFPPHSSYCNQIDRFTFLPQVLESRRGVCLGVSTLYLCLAQRVGLPFEIITPPGHIFLRSRDLNIETTLRGVHIHNDEYLGINLLELPKRTLKEVVGMAYFNQASVWLAAGDFQKAAAAYERSLPFTPADPYTQTLYACSLYLSGQEAKAKKILAEVVPHKESFCISQDPLAEDILHGKVDPECLKPLFLYVDESRASIESKKEALEQTVKKYPQFRSALFQLAICYLQLQRPQDAIRILEQYHQVDPTDISVEYYLAELYYSRYDAKSAWQAYTSAERLASKKGHLPRALVRFKTLLSTRSPAITCQE